MDDRKPERTNKTEGTHEGGRWKAKVQKAAVFIHEPKDQAEECGPRTQRESPRGQVKKRIKKQVKFTAVIHI